MDSRVASSCMISHLLCPNASVLLAMFGCGVGDRRGRVGKMEGRACQANAFQ